MTIDDLKELPIPDGFPEKMKEVLRRKNAFLRERKRLIEEEVSYNDFTIKTFEKYIKDFQTLYPGILTDEEIMKRLKANIKHDITYSYIKNSNGENNKKITGYFDATTHSVILNKEYYESLKDKSVINRTIFHELTHALVEKNPYDYNIEHEAYENANFVSESIITIMEEDYVRVIEGRKVKRVNGYIPTYAHELRAIYGNDLIKHFVGDFKHIDPLFFRDEETYESFGTEIIPIMDSIYFGVREVKEDVDVSYYNKLVELGISSLLDEYLSTTILSEEQKLKKITDLAKLQIYPDFNIFQEMIHKYIKDESLIKNDPIANLLYYKKHNKEHIGYDLDSDYNHMITKLNGFNANGLYGANELFKNDEELYPHYDRDRCKHYKKNESLYKNLYGLLRNGDIEEEDLNIISLEKNSKKMSMGYMDVKDQIGSGFSQTEVNLFNTFFSDKDIYKCKTEHKEFFIVDNMFSSLLVPQATNDVIIALLEDAKKETEEDDLEGLKDGIIKLKKLEDQGIDKVYSDGIAFVYEKDGITYVNTPSYTTDEQGVDHGIYKEERVKLKKVAPPSLNMSTKKL